MATRFTPTCWICDKDVTLENCKIDEYGKSVHAQCYVAKLAHPNGESISEKELRSRELRALSKTEQDPQKLSALVHKMNQLLEEIEQLKGQAPTDS